MNKIRFLDWICCVRIPTPLRNKLYYTHKGSSRKVTKQQVQLVKGQITLSSA